MNESIRLLERPTVSRGWLALKPSEYLALLLEKGETKGRY